MVDEGLNIKEKVQKLLAEGEYDKKRARTMDMDDFLGQVLNTLMLFSLIYLGLSSFFFSLTNNVHLSWPIMSIVGDSLPIPHSNVISIQTRLFAHCHLISLANDTRNDLFL